MLSPAEAQAAVERYGSQRRAAAAFGVSRSTFRYWLFPAVDKERARRNYRANRERKLKYMHDRYFDMDGIAIGRRLLQSRRHKALLRLAKRNEGKASGTLPKQG